MVVASDDFGVKSVALQVNGKQVAVDSTRPYEFAYTPTYADLGPLTLTAVATDSSGQTTSTSIHLTVPNPAGYVAATLTPTSWDAGTVLVGLNATQTFTVTDSGQNPITLGAITATGSGFKVLPGGCATGATIPVGGSCTVTVAFAPTAEGPIDRLALGRLHRAGRHEPAHRDARRQRAHLPDQPAEPRRPGRSRRRSR